MCNACTLALSCTGNFLKHGFNAFTVASSPSFSFSKLHQLKQSACKEKFVKLFYYYFFNLLHYYYRPVKIHVRITDFLLCMHLYNYFRGGHWWGRGTQYLNTVRKIGKYRYRIYDRSRLFKVISISRVYLYAPAINLIKREWIILS